MIYIDAYKYIVGKIMYYATKIAPEICNAVRELAGHLSNTGEDHWKVLERCVGYLTDQATKASCLRKPRVLQSISYCDSDYAKDENDRRSVSGQINTLGGMIANWTSKKQQTVSLSSSEAEHQALSECTQEAVFTRNLVGQKKPAIIYEDNLGTIFLVKNRKVSSRTKHIDIRHHFMRDLQDRKELDVRLKRSKNNSADIMTKNTTKDIHENHIKQIRNGSLPFWKEYVEQDSSVTEFTHSRMSTKYSPVHSSTNSSHISNHRSPERQRNRWNQLRAR
jgi:hypothetical protein